MSKNYTRDQRRKYKAKRVAKAQEIADRLMGKKKPVTFDTSDFFGSSKMYEPIMYSGNIVSHNPRLSSIIIGVQGV